jgi:hypothetical protein
MTELNEKDEGAKGASSDSAVPNDDSDKRKEWTLMFYFASDNPLAPGIVTQLKALKAAGFHQKANVIAHYDPQTPNTPTHVFDVNLINKLKNPDLDDFIGFEADDPFVRNLVMDRLWSEGDTEIIEKIRTYLRFHPRDRRGHSQEADVADNTAETGGEKEPDPVIIYDPPRVPESMCGEQNSVASLNDFLKFCGDNYKANHYLLFILGHGIVVGNDVFLFDENLPGTNPAVNPPTHPASGTTPDPTKEPNGEAKPDPDQKGFLTLKDLGDVLNKFTTQVGQERFEALVLHSCSMSSAEVAYELRNTAKFMLASQGPAYVGSWPYKEILIRIFKDIQRGVDFTKVNEIKLMLERIYYYVLHNSLDFELAGYSFDLAFSDLRSFRMKSLPPNADGTPNLTIFETIKNLGAALTDGLKDPIVRGLILLAHWDAQSFWQETYTDLYDFCLCLTNRIAGSIPGQNTAVIDSIVTACTDVRKLLVAGAKNGPVLHTGFAGSDSQYTHGLSLFFPWSKPTQDNFWNQYQTAYDFRDTGWHSFLTDYFELTKRTSRAMEDDPLNQKLQARLGSTGNPTEDALVDVIRAIAGRAFVDSETLGPIKSGPGDPMSGPKTGPPDPTGGSDCGCPSIKNYPVFRRRDPRDTHESGSSNNFPLSRDVGTKLSF